MKLNPEDILKILNENDISFATRVNIKCVNGHKYAIKLGEMDGCCPDCKRYTKSYIEDMIEKRRAKSLRIKDSDEEKITPCGVYIVKLSRGDEVFYKIGLSTKSPLERLRDIPYNVETIKVIFSNSSGATLIERHLHKIHDENNLSYVPEIGFVGCSECFSDLLLSEIDSFVLDQEQSVQKAAVTWLQNI